MAGERPQFLPVLMTGWASDQKNAYTLGRVFSSRSVMTHDTVCGKGAFTVLKLNHLYKVGVTQQERRHSLHCILLTFLLYKCMPCKLPSCEVSQPGNYLFKFADVVLKGVVHFKKNSIPKKVTFLFFMLNRSEQKI